MINTFKTYNLEETMNKFIALEKRAKKLNVQVPKVIEIIEGIEEELNKKTKVIVYHKFHNIKVEYFPIILDDWELIAQVDHSNYDGNVFHKINFDIEIPEQYRTTDQFLCEHCHSNRQRNFTYIVYRESEFKQVGSTCLKDFCGHSFNIVNSYLNDLNELSENCGESRINPMVNRNQFLELVAFTARTRGYVTGKEYYEKLELPEALVEILGILFLILKKISAELILILLTMTNFLPRKLLK